MAQLNKIDSRLSMQGTVDAHLVTVRVSTCQLPMIQPMIKLY